MAEAVIHRWVYLASNLAARLFDCAIVDFQQSICIAVKRSYPEAITKRRLKCRKLNEAAEVLIVVSLRQAHSTTLCEENKGKFACGQM
jgi:uncharacterized Rossmann fold enzyme